MREPSLQAVTVAYQRSGLAPCGCGTQLHRLADGRIAGGPFVALFLSEIKQVAADVHDDDASDIASLAETWAISRWGWPVYISYAEGFDTLGRVNFEGMADLPRDEFFAFSEGSSASRTLGAIRLPISSKEIVPC